MSVVDEDYVFVKDSKDRREEFFGIFKIIRLK